MARCHLALGELYRKVRRPNSARAELSAAIELFRSMEMTFWLDRAESALGLSERPLGGQHSAAKGFPDVMRNFLGG